VSKRVLMIPARLAAVLTAAAASLVLVVGFVPVASAAVGSWAFSDSHPVVESSLQSQLAMIESGTCRFPAVPARNLSLGTALSSASRLLVVGDGARALRRFDASPEARSYRRAMSAALAATLVNRPDAALAALLRAHALAPRDPRPLVDASVVLTGIGSPNEALALLGAAARLGEPGRAPMGISRRAVLESDRGYALVALHQWRAAGAALSAAVRGAPLLSEAEHNLAVVKACTGQPGKAMLLLAAAARRDPVPASRLVVNKINQSSRPRLSDTFDLSKGETAQLPMLSYPPDAPHGVAAYPQFLALDMQLQAKSSADAQLTGQLQGQLARVRLSLVTRRRISDVLAGIGDAEQEPGIKPLADAWQSARINEATVGVTFAQKGCGNRPSWLQSMQVLGDDARKLAIAEYRLDTALAANLATPVAHQLALAISRYKLEATFNGTAVVPAAMWTNGEDRICAAQQSAAASQEVSGSVVDSGVPPCPSGLQGTDFGLSLGFVSFSVNCDEVGLDVSSLGWIGAFGNLSHNFRTGSTTIMVGPQVGVNIQAGPFGGGAQARVGGYITVGGDGAISDVGMRGQVGVSGSVGPTSAYVGTSIDVSFAGAN
jgi:hypothetical protein